MENIFNIVIPVFGIIVCGYFAGVFKILNKANAEAVNKFVYYFALPPLLFTSTARAPFHAIFNWSFIALYLGGVGLTLVIGFFVGRYIFRKRQPELTIQMFATIFANTAYMGIPIFLYKLLSFAISSFYAGFAGALFTYYTMSINPEPFNLWLSIEFIAMIIIGGLGSIPGAVFGTIFIVMLNEILSHATQFLMNVGATGLGITIAPLREFVFGLAIVLFIIFEPKGLAEVWRIVRSSFRLWPFSY